MAVVGARPSVTKDQLLRYVDQRLTTEQMAERVGMERTSIASALRRHKFRWEQSPDDINGVWHPPERPFR